MDYQILIDKANLFLCIFLAVCLLVILAIMLDLWDGVYTARQTGQRIHSHRLRVTIEKMSEYWRFLIIGFFVDCIGILFDFYRFPFIAILFGIALIAVETKSMFEHAKIRKGHAADVPGMIRRIITCAKEQDAQRIIEEICGNGEKYNDD